MAKGALTKHITKNKLLDEGLIADYGGCNIENECENYNKQLNNKDITE